MCLRGDNQNSNDPVVTVLKQETSNVFIFGGVYIQTCEYFEGFSGNEIHRLIKTSIFSPFSVGTMNSSSTFKMIKLPLLKVRSCIRVGGYPIFQTLIHSQLYERVYSNNRQKIYDDGHSLLRSLRSQSIGFWGREPHKYDPNELEFPP